MTKFRRNLIKFEEEAYFLPWKWLRLGRRLPSDRCIKQNMAGAIPCPILSREEVAKPNLSSMTSSNAQTLPFAIPQKRAHPAFSEVIMQTPMMISMLSTALTSC